jgi:putative oxidoreductase
MTAKTQFSTSDAGSLITRTFLATVLFPHGCQLTFGLFGGSGFGPTMSYFTGVEKLPYFVGVMVILIQFLGSIFILAGLATRLVSFSVVILFIGMVLTSHIEFGFFMNWFGGQKGEGYEFHLLVIGMASSLIATGAGKYSASALLQRLIKKPAIIWTKFLID